jgi:hypothetical protein
MNVNFIILTIFTNCLISVLAAFLAYYVFSMQSFGGFWLLSVIALVGAYIGTFVGIVFQLIKIYLPTLVIIIIIPLISSCFFVVMYIYLNKFRHHD